MHIKSGCIRCLSFLTYDLICDILDMSVDQRALGFSMRVERADVTSVKSRIEQLKAQVASKAASALLPQVPAIEVYDSRLQADLQEKEALKQKLKREAELRKKEKQVIAEIEAEGIEERDEDFESMMGFTGFGTSKKR